MANDLDAYIPEIWAQESLMILEEQMVAANLVHRAFSNDVARFGDTVNTRRPTNFEMKRKTDADDVTDQDAEATNVAVKLNQHNHVSFVIQDGEESKGFLTLREEYLVPAMIAIARGLDQVILGQAYQFLGNIAGSLGTAATKAALTSTRTLLNNNKAPLVGRNLIISPDTEADLLNVGDFVNANTRGDDGSALREANLGRLLGFDTFMCQNTPSVSDGSSTEGAQVNNVGGYPIGATTITIDTTSEDLTAGSWCTIVGDMIPQKITAATGSPTTEITISPGLKRAVADDAVVTVYTPGAIDNTGGYAEGYAKNLTIDTFTVAPQSGQLISIGAAASKPNYSAIGTPTTTSMMLDRPMESTETDSTVIGVGPAGQYNLAFHQNAIALVSRPLAPPAPGTGALSYVASNNGVGVRVTITYDGKAQGHRVTVDMLSGIKVLDTNLGAVMLA